MHQFFNNLFYYYQIDVVDAEYSALVRGMGLEGAEFESVVRLHRGFVSNLVTQCMLDNTVIQDVLEGLVHLAVRFLAVCKLLLAEPADDSSGGAAPIPPVYVPLEELDALSAEFTAQLTQLVYVMKKLDTGMYVRWLYVIVCGIFTCAA